MTCPVLFVGTSFLGAIKQGYDSLFRGNGPVTFIGLNAPELAANLESGWKVADGCLRLSSRFGCFIAGESENVEESSGSKTFPGTAKVSGLEIDLRSFGRIIFVDMFHRLRPYFSVNEEELTYTKRGPVSARLISELQFNGFNGWISLSQHPQHGDVPFVNAKRLLSAVRGSARSASVMLVSAPRPSFRNVDIQARYGDVASARRLFEYLERFYMRELARYEIEYLAQPSEVLDEDGCFTREEYSRGSHPTIGGMSDEHMNRRYGAVILAQYSQRILD